MHDVTPQTDSQALISKKKRKKSYEAKGHNSIVIIGKHLYPGWGSSAAGRGQKKNSAEE